jgi:signal transduction histidine kinase
VLLFLVIGVLAPTVCVLWFMNEAAKNQADAGRQHVAEAYRGQLRFLRDAIDSFWETRAADLEKAAATRGATGFQNIVAAGLADSVVYFNESGSPTYPSPPAPRADDPLINRADWRAAQGLEGRGNRSAAATAYANIAKSERDPNVAARAAQGQIRCLVQNGETDAALRAIVEQFRSRPIARGIDLQGRRIAADDQLLALRLMKAAMKPDDRRYLAGVQRLVALLNDYKNASIPSSQRIFLMDAVRELTLVEFPTHEAERLAAQFLDSDTVRPGDPVLQASSVPGVWKFPVKSGRMIALYRSDSVLAAALGLLNGQNSSGVQFAMIPPGTASPGETIAASPLLPGWQISFSLVDTKPMEAMARQSKVTYLWVGYLVAAAMAMMGLFLGQSFRRQLRLTRLKTDLVAAVSHEFKTPLASMRVLVDSLLEDRQFDPAKTRDYLHLIAGENLRLSRLIENFLTFSRIERNRQRFEFSEIRPERVIQSAVAAIHERFQQDCDLKVEIGSTLPRVYGDEDALVTVLLNLLDNAYKYTGNDKRIVVRALQDGGGVVFAVEDNGIGIAARDQKRIFQRFFQVDRSLARETGGVGLGLSIVDFIVRAHGGVVRIKSRLGEGSTFAVRLPCDRKAERAPA